MFQGMEYIYEVYKENSFSKAAQKLFISQPSLSANVKRVEKKIGYPIFDRSTKPLKLTECGERYIRAVESIMAIENEFSDYVNDLGDLKSGKLVIGGSSLFSSLVLPPLMGEFSEKFPFVELDLVEESTAKLEEMLQNGTIDLFLDNCVLSDETFDAHFMTKEYLLLAVPKKLDVNQGLEKYQIHPEEIRKGTFLKNQIEPVPLEQFKNESFFVLKPENDTRIRAMEIFQKNHFMPKILFELDQQMTSYNITCSGMGISFISSTLISRVPPHKEVVYYKLDEKSCSRNLYFYRKKGRYFSRAMEEFLKIADTYGIQ